jgi:hypothetical protein
MVSANGSNPVKARLAITGQDGDEADRVTDRSTSSSALLT